jgi:hypothetical protein
MTIECHESAIIGSRYFVDPIAEKKATIIRGNADFVLCDVASIEIDDVGT